MECLRCARPNDDDAAFCVHCGEPVDVQSQEPISAPRKSYGYALALIPVILLALGVGYYKFFLPHGVVAVVNGEDIHRSELEEGVDRMLHRERDHYARRNSSSDGKEDAIKDLRYQVLTRLIRERLMVQEAKKAGITVSTSEVDAAFERLQVPSAAAHYGSLRAFKSAMKRDLLVNKYITDHVVRGLSDPAEMHAAVERWFRSVSKEAQVRITLSEQWSGAGCGCCGDRRSPGSQRKDGCAGERTNGDSAKLWPKHPLPGFSRRR
ncbi:MAG TPA: hypothetical protein DCO77_07455 [Nitrospiraceae bacterium]|nr:hypothetical protein [Nitrospiraceae bacterium]